MDILKEGLTRLCVDPRTAALIQNRLDDIVVHLNVYMDEIERFNPAYGLVKTADRKELIVKHILDSITPLGNLAGLFARDPVLRVADAGSGAGLPGIPLAVCLPRAEVTLIERMARRAGFLRNTTAVLGLGGIVVEETELEKAEGGRFDLVVFRALTPLSDKAVQPLVRLLKAPSGGMCNSTGILAAYKGKHVTAARELAGCSAAASAAVIPLQPPFLDEERCLVVIRHGSMDAAAE